MIQDRQLRDQFEESHLFKIQTRISSISLQILQSCNIIGRNFYISLILIEHVIICSILFVNSQLDLYDNVNEKWFHTHDIHLYDSQTSNVTSNIFAIGFFIFCILIAGLNAYLYFCMSDTVIKNSNNNKIEFTNLTQLTAGWCSLQKTLLSYGFGYSFITIILNFNNYQQQSISSSVYSYLQCVLLFLGSAAFINNYLLTFHLLIVPMNVPTLPWNSSSSEKLHFCKELLKIIIIMQDYFLQIFEANQSQIKLAVYYCIIFVVLLTLVISPPIYFDSKVNRTYLLANYITLYFALISTARASLNLNFLQILLFTPIIGYAIIALILKNNENIFNQTIRDIIEVRKPNIPVTNLFQSIQYLLQILDKIQSDPTFERISDANQDHIELTAKESQFLTHIHYMHRLNCFNELCICRHYEFICRDQFKITYQEVDEGLMSSKDEKSGINSSQNQSTSMEGSPFGKNQLQSFPNKFNISKCQSENPNLSTKYSDVTKTSKMADEVVCASQGSSLNRLNDDCVLEKICLIDIFTLEKQFENSVSQKEIAIISKFQLYENMQNIEEMKEDILMRNFKNSNEAKVYYYLNLVCEVIDNFNKNLGNSKNMVNGNRQLNRNEYISNIDVELKLLMASFQSKYLGKPFLAIQSLIQSSYSEKERTQGFFAEIKFKMCESLIMKNIIKNLGQEESETLVNFANFIEQNEKHKYLDQLYDDTAQDIFEFWKQLNGDVPNVEQFFKKGQQISRAISDILKYQNNNKETYDICDIGRISLRIYFHHTLMNDYQTAQSIQKVLSEQISKKNLLSSQEGSQGRDQLIHYSKSIVDHSYSNYKTALSSKFLNQEHLSGLCMVSLTSLDFENITIQFANKDLAEIFGTQDGSLDGKNIKMLMPKLIRRCHSEIIQRFFNSRNSSILSRDRVTFLRDNNGFLKPIKFKLEFNYDYRYKYVFVAQIQPLSYFQSGRNDKIGSKVSVKNSMIFITDQDYTIIDISQNVLTLGGFEDQFDQWESSELTQGRPHSIEDFIPDIVDFCNQMKQETSSQNLTFRNKLVSFNKYSKNDRFIVTTQSFMAILTCLEETFTSTSANQYTFIVTPLSDHPDAEFYISKNETLLRVLQDQTKTEIDMTSYFDSKGKALSSIIKASKQASVHHTKHISQDQQEDDYDLQSVSSRASSSRNSDSKIGDTAYIVQNLLFKHKTPRIMFVASYILCLMILAFLGVNIFNLTVFLNKHSLIGPRIQNYRLSNQRNLVFRSILLDIQMLHEIASKQFESPEINNTARLELYNQSLTKNNQLARKYTQTMDEENRMFQNFEKIIKDTTFLSDERVVYLKMLSFKNQNNLLIQNIEALNIDILFNKTPHINVTNYLERKMYINQPASETEKQIYFIYLNGLNRMEESSFRQQGESQNITLQESIQSRSDISLKAYISVGILAGILLFLIPLFIRVFNRRYQVVHYFMQVTQMSIIKSENNAYQYHQKLKQIYNNDEQEVQWKDKSISQVQKMDTHKTKNAQNKEIKHLKTHKSQAKNYKKDKLSHQKHLEILEENINDVSISSSRSSTDSLGRKHQDSIIADISIEEAQRIQELSISTQRDQMMTQFIQKSQLGQKMKLIVITALLIGYLNSIFLISNSYSNSVFLSNEVQMFDIQKYFDRENCAMNMILFMRKQILRNSTTMTRYQFEGTKYKTVSAIDLYLKKCLIIENQVAKALKLTPDYLSEAETILANQENNQYCNSTFPEQEQAQQCNKAMDGILQNGVGSAMSQLINLINQVQIGYNSKHVIRTAEYINDQIKSPKFLQIIDLVAFQLKEGFRKTEDAIIQSLQNYFELARIYYLLLVGIFVSATLVMFIIGGILMFQRIKQMILEVQNILVLIPFDDLESAHRISIEKYLSS